MKSLLAGVNFKSTVNESCNPTYFETSSPLNIIYYSVALLS